MKLKDKEYVYCLSFLSHFPEQCPKCKRNIKLYENYENDPLYWIDIPLFGKKKCSRFKKLEKE